MIDSEVLCINSFGKKVGNYVIAMKNISYILFPFTHTH